MPEIFSNIDINTFLKTYVLEAFFSFAVEREVGEKTRLSTLDFCTACFHLTTSQLDQGILGDYFDCQLSQVSNAHIKFLHYFKIWESSSCIHTYSYFPFSFSSFIAMARSLVIESSNSFLLFPQISSTSITVRLSLYPFFFKSKPQYSQYSIIRHKCEC